MRPSNKRRGFSLLEMIAALAISAILTGAMATVLVASSSAMERGVDASAHERSAGRVVSEMEQDLAEATKFFEQTATSIWFEVPDRNEDGVAEHIRYAWSGTPGGDLTRSTNGGTPGVVATNVQTFGIALTERPGLKRTEGPEQLLASFTAHAGASSNGYQISTTAWAGQIVRPTFAANASSWKVTRVRIRMRSYITPDGLFLVSIVPLDATNNPASPAFAATGMNESSLNGSYRWQETVFASCNPIRPGEAVAIRVSGVSGSAVQSELETLVSATPTMPFNSWMTTSTNAGMGWQAYPQTRSLVFELYGTVTTEER